MRRTLILPLTLAVLVIGTTAISASAQARRAMGWRKVASLSVSQDDVAVLSGVAAAGGHAWAVGGIGQSRLVTAPLVARWSGHAWSRVHLPREVVARLGAAPVLAGVSVSGDGNMWAFTSGGSGWLHWNGMKWSAGQIFRVDILGAILATGRHSAWAFGTNLVRSGEKPYAAYRTPRGWHQTAVPGKGSIAAASAVSAGDVWAVLGNGQTGFPPGPAGSLVHWYHRRWHAVTLPRALRTQWLGSVLARNDHDVWVGGAVHNHHGGTTEAVGRWNGKRWSVTRFSAYPSAGPLLVTSLVPDGAGGIWALGICDYGNRCHGKLARRARLWHLNGGRWTGPARPRLGAGINLLYSLATDGHSVWASGVSATSLHPVRAKGLVALWGPTP